MALQKTQPGTYVYSFSDCRVINGNTSCSGGAGASVTINIPQPAVTATLSPATISEGGTATLAWSSTNATHCSAAGISGVSATSGSVTYHAPTVMSADQTVTIPVTCINGGASATANATVTVRWVNDLPTISAISNRTINEDTSTGAIAFTVGDEETPAGSLVVTATSSNTLLVPNNRLVLGGSGANRTLTVTPAVNAFGSANITVRVTDAHGAHAQRTFTVTVNPVNDAPTMTAISNITIDEGSSTGARAFTINDIDTPIANLTVLATSSNTTLVPNGNIALGGSGTNRTINITPAANRNGSATITVTVSDGELTASRSFVVTVRDLPAAFTSIPDSSNNGVVALSWAYAREYVTLRVRELSGDWVTLINQGNPSGSYTDTRTRNGTYIYQILDCYYAGGSHNGNPTCTVTDTRPVEVIFSAPVITAGFSPASINESPNSGAANTATLSWSATNAQSCSATGISGVNSTTGSVTYTAPSVMINNQQLNVVITCTGQGPSSSTKTASLTINAVNDVPTISSFSARTIDEDTSTGAIPFTVGDEETPAGSLVVTATSSNTSLVPNNRLVLGGSGANRTLTVTPSDNAHGVTTITVTVTDADGASAQRSFVLTVNFVNDLPTLSAIPDQRIAVDASTPTLNFTVGDIETPPDLLTVTASSNKPGLVAPSGIVLGGSGASRAVKVTPVAGQSGLATVTLTVTDTDGGESIRSFKVSVLDDISTVFDMSQAPTEFTYSLTGGVTALDNSDFVAITQGSLNVDSGASSYTIPIELPPAIRDLAPTLSLGYHSHHGDSVMGVGWSLGGLSSIHRCRTTFATERAQAQKSNPGYSQGDRLCLDGRKLVIAGSTTPANDSTYWATNAVYQTEIDSFARIQAHGSHHGAHRYFTMTTKDGRTLTFGREATGQNSRIYAPGQANGPVNTWALDQVEDRYGNSYRVHYLRDTTKGEYYPSHITWEPESAVVFSYINRTGNTPWGYDSGHKYEHSKLLDKVTTYIGVTNSSVPTAGTKVKEYAIDYQLSVTTNRHLVKEIRECGFTEIGARQCAKPLQFEWQKGELGFEDTAQPLAYKGVFEDINNNGFVDVIGEKSILAWGSANGFVAANDSEDEFIRIIQTRFGKYTVRGVLRGDYVDIKVVRMSPSGATTYSTVVSVLKEDLPHIHAVDLNNNGLTDLYIGGHVWIQQDDASFVESPATVGLPYKSPSSESGIQPQFVDVNNNGLLDLTSVSLHGWLGAGQFNNVLYADHNTGNSFNGRGSLGRVSSSAPIFEIPGHGIPFAQRHVTHRANLGYWHSWIDINGDGNAEVLYLDRHSGAAQWRVRLSTGEGPPYSQRPLIATGASAVPMTPAVLGQYSFVMDYNKDGRDDFIVFTGTLHERVMRVFHSSYVNGTLSFVNGGVDPFMGKLDYLKYLETSIAEKNFNPFRGDINNDGIPDLVVGNHVYYGKQQKPDLLIKITDGFGAETQLAYSPLTGDDNNGKPLYAPSPIAPTFPHAPVDRSLQVVKELSVSNGMGGQVHTWFNYLGGIQDLQGRGFLGFASVETTRSDTGVRTVTNYRQDYPYTGKVSSVLSRAADGRLISRAQHHYALHPDNSRFPYPVRSLRQDYQLLTTSLHYPLVVSKEENSFDACGNLTARTTTTGNGLSGTTVTGIMETSTLINTLINTGDSDCSDDFVTATTVTTTKAGGANPRTVTTRFEPNDQFDVYQQTVFEGTAMEVVTTTHRDSQGLITGSSTLAADLNNTTTAARTTTFSDFDKVMYPATVTNAEGHVANVNYDYRFGKVNQEADPNGLISVRDFDVLGRSVREVGTDGTVTELLSWYCDNAPVTCPAHAVYLTATRITHPHESGKLGAPLSITYYDSLQRVVRSEAYSLGQAVVKSDIQYTAEGYLHRVSEPFTSFASDWTIYSDYDALGRANTVTSPDGGSLSVAYRRDGGRLKTTEALTIITPNGTDTQTTQRYTNALGQVVKAEDALGTPVDYTYDAHGNLETTIVDNNVLTTISLTHDLAGNRTRIIDPDAGVIDFAYNGFGELRKQTWQPNLSGHAKSITWAYDRLGRRTVRIDQPASGSATSYTWVWDTQKVGLLTSQSGNGYSETYTYDHLSRLRTQAATLSGLAGSRVFTYDYDSFSRATTTTYPSGLSIARDYQAAGMHVRTRDITAGANDTLWARGSVINERGQFTHELYGNGVVTARGYTLSNGRLETITSGRLTANNTLNSLGGDIQALSYTFDSLGNLYHRNTRRTDNNGLPRENTTESFAYDALNRVTASTTSGLFSRILDYDYDRLGNLTYRSGVGDLTYNRSGNAGVHAVTSSGTSGTPGYRTYAYDRYGNMTQRGGETITYNVFNKPLTISGSSGTSSFSYGPNHERFKQISGGKTTYVINGGSYEEIIDDTTGSVTQKTYVGGFLVHTKTGDTTDITYLHKDHLGSTEAMTDQNGNLKGRMSFGVWGERQQSGWETGMPSTGELSTFKTLRGYTGHEQLDSHNLIHMGGRVYDPTLGRFLSADLYIQAPYNTQSFNRYSYVFNNPLSYIDPTGYRGAPATGNTHALQVAVSDNILSQASYRDLMTLRQNNAIANSNNQMLFSQQAMQSFVRDLIGQGSTSFTYVESSGQTVVVNIDTQAFNVATAGTGAAAGGDSRSDGSANGEGLSLDAQEGDGGIRIKNGVLVDANGQPILDQNGNSMRVQMGMTPNPKIVAAAVALHSKKLFNTLKTAFGKGNPTKPGANGKLQPYDAKTGRYLSPEANPGLVHSPAGRFGAGFAQGVAEANGSGAQGATPVGAAGNAGHLIGTIVGHIGQLF